jgi:hypothetical protein
MEITKKKSFDYRKFYEEQTNCGIQLYWDVHHLDLNHDNNDFDNLLAIPRSLHRKYHLCLRQFNSIYTFIPHLGGSIGHHGSNEIDFILDINDTYIKGLRKMNGILVEFAKYIDLKNKILYAN